MKKIAVIGTGFRRTGDDKPPQEILDVRAESFDPRLIETRLPAFPVNEINRNMSEVANIETGLRAESEGFDAIFINTVGDYGFSALRSAVRIPVVGAGQATMHAACQLGGKFSIVTIWPPQLLFIYHGLLQLYRMEDRCVSIRCVSADEELDTLSDDKNFVTDMRSGETSQQDRIVRQCEKAIQDDGADTIMLGCTCMSPAAKDIAARVDAPVLNPLTTGYKAAEMQLALGLSHSVHKYPQAGGDRHDHYRAMADAVKALDFQDPRGQTKEAAE
ncbi:MAG: aspartate/glutamate racemase family protein [Alphaproteobacteria bacterium]|nr:aspartate/glutamate racemase family protein [Alphaproteobacteria bacterium]